MLEIMVGTRVVATPTALDSATWPDNALILRLAPDDAVVFGGTGAPVLDDEHAIIEREAGFAGVWLDTDTTERLVRHHVEWRVPETRPVFAQGMVAGIAAKLWLEDDRALLLTAAVHAHELWERIA